MKTWMHSWMGFFLVVFSMLKLFDLRGFAMGFRKYDLLKPLAAYGLIYPFIELALGLGFLAHWNPPVIYAATGIVMSVALLEDVAMSAMAFALLLIG